MYQIEPLLDAIETPFDPVDSSRLARDLCLQVADLSHDVFALFIGVLPPKP